mmetsp:Transcript_17418/g.29309  ORF Transcript_17418/g.29309 Transcript_17418/m.29309 type:complete len:298 (-) Transcript_17418:110-1003(-)
MWRGNIDQAEERQEQCQGSKKTTIQAPNQRRDWSTSKATHFVSIPLAINNPKVRKSFIEFRDMLLGDQELDVCKRGQLNKSSFPCSSLLHLGVLQIDLIDEQKLDQAKALMKELEVEFQGMLGGQKIEVSFKGLRTADYLSPTLASNLFCDIDQAEQASSSPSYIILRQLVHKTIDSFVKAGLVSRNDLAVSHVQFDNQAQQYVNKKLNVQVIQAKRGQKFNAQQIISKYGAFNLFGGSGQLDKGKGRQGAKLRLEQFHLSCKQMYECKDGSKRMDKQLFGNVHQIEETEQAALTEQ